MATATLIETVKKIEDTFVKLALFNPAQIAASIDEMEFRHLSNFDDGAVGVFWSEAGGPSPWEMHQDCDELLHVIAGEIEVEVLPDDGGESCVVTVSEGDVLVVPRGCWHRQTLNPRRQSSA